MSTAFWFSIAYGLVTGSVGALLTAVTQLSGTTDPIAPNTWLVILATGVASGATAGKAAWKPSL